MFCQLLEVLKPIKGIFIIIFFCFPRIFPNYLILLKVYFIPVCYCLNFYDSHRTMTLNLHLFQLILLMSCRWLQLIIKKAHKAPQVTSGSGYKWFHL